MKSGKTGRERTLGVKHPEQRNLLVLQLDTREAAFALGLKGAAYAVLKELVLRADKAKGWTCFPSIAVIAEDAMCSVSSVEHALTKLVKLKLIKTWASSLSASQNADSAVPQAC